jgi:hypothetical protein
MGPLLTLEVSEALRAAARAKTGDSNKRKAG